MFTIIFQALASHNNQTKMLKYLLWNYTANYFLQDTQIDIQK